MDSGDERKLHKHKKIRKSYDRDRPEKKDRHEKKKDRRDDRDERDRHRRDDRERERPQDDRKERPPRYERTSPPKRVATEQPREEPARQVAVREEKQYIPRTHIQCRRCQNETFSLKMKQCSSCGYPKEERPANFPVTKEIDVMEMIRAGKLTHNSYAPVLIEVVVNDRMGRKQRIKCSPKDTVFDLKKLTAAQIGTRPQKIRLQKSSVIYKDHLTLQDYEIKDGMGLEMYYD